MADSTPVLYEALFLMSQTALASDTEGTIGHVKEMLDRAEAETLDLRQWDERKLAYPVEGQKRGTFLISYFRARPTQIANIERDCNLSEQVLRVMFVRGDHMGEIELNLALEGKSFAEEENKKEEAKREAEAAEKAEKQEAAAAAATE
ncbi:MAG: 30S ribosomal protein S6 [Phycisphaeraceae bacterium]|nr:30S ribosomal protein S6 [Phycisphaeraceae bacterium]